MNALTTYPLVIIATVCNLDSVQPFFSFLKSGFVLFSYSKN